VCPSTRIQRLDPFHLGSFVDFGDGFCYGFEYRKRMGRIGDRVGHVDFLVCCCRFDQRIGPVQLEVDPRGYLGEFLAWTRADAVY
jgi:hypothetical protein